MIRGNTYQYIKTLCSVYFKEYIQYLSNAKQIQSKIKKPIIITVEQILTTQNVCLKILKYVVIKVDKINIFIIS